MDSDVDRMPVADPPVGAKIRRSEWRWVLIWTVVILAFTSLPYLVGGQLAAGGEMTFGGFVIGVEDGNSYLAKMGQGARGNWLFRIVYTSEPHRGALFFLFHILLGKLASWLPGRPADLPLRMIWVYHVARWVCAAGLLASVYRFVAEFLSELIQRRLAWLMIALGGGLGWLLLALEAGDWLGSPPLDFVLPEGFTFLVIFSLPHIALGRALLLLGFLAWLKGVLHSPRWVILAGVLWLLMALIVPFYPVVAGTVVLATLVTWWLVGGRYHGHASLWRDLALSAVAGLIVAPAVLYSGWVFLTDPVMKGWSAQNLILSPHPLHYLVAYLLPGLLAAFGLIRLWRKRPGDKHWLLFAWVLVVPLLLYVPFNLQRRLIEGYQVPLYTVAVIGAIGVVWPALKNRLGRPRILAVALLALMVPTSLILVAGSTLAVTAQQPPIFHPPERIGLADWLTENASEGDLVLSDYSAGNFLPAWSPVRSYYGHGPETIDFPTKEANVGRFYSDEEDDEWRRRLLAENSVSYVLHGPSERALGGFMPSEAPFLAPVYEQDGLVLFAVEGDEG